MGFNRNMLLPHLTMQVEVSSPMEDSDRHFIYVDLMGNQENPLCAAFTLCKDVLKLKEQGQQVLRKVRSGYSKTAIKSWPSQQRCSYEILGKSSLLR